MVVMMVKDTAQQRVAMLCADIVTSTDGGWMIRD
jgi:hypothetical protein